MIKEVNFTTVLLKKWLKDNNIEMYSINNEAKSVFVEKFIRTSNTKIYKYITSISKNVYIDKLGEEVNDKDPKLKVGDHVRIS